MDQDKTVRLLIVDPSLNDAETVSSVLRNAGKPVRPKRVDGESGVTEALEKESHDLVLFDTAQSEPDTERLKEVIGETGRDLPIIGLTNEGYSEEAVGAALEAGLSDLVSKGDGRHLCAVFDRELEALRVRRALRRTEHALRESEKRCDALLDSSRDAIAYIHEGMHVYANRAYLELFGFDEFEEIEGTPIMDMVAQEHHGELKGYLRRYAQEGETSTQQLEFKGQRADGATFTAQMEFSPASIEGEACTQIVIRSEPASGELENKIQYLSQQDLVTGLYNRQYFMEQLESAVSRAVNHGDSSALLCAQLDNFRQIKESVGIAGADLVIGDVAGLIKDALGEADAAARFSDNTFTVLTAHKDNNETQALAERIRDAVEHHIADVNGQSVTTTCSIGISPINESAPNAPEVVSRADQACEQAHDAGGNRVQVHNPVAEQRATKARDQEWIGQLRMALDNNRFKLVYQPVASLHGDSDEKYEVLLRMLDENGDVVLPEQFLPVAEQAGLMGEVDRWVIGRAIQVLRDRRQSERSTTCFVKISTQSLADPELLRWLSEQLKEARLQADSLVLEVAESAAVTRLKEAKTFVKALKQLHCGFALEHFGNGVNSFHILKHLPADYLKIDGSFMKDLPDNTENQEMVKSITETAHSMNKLVIAEFVEDANSLAILWQMGVNYIQGNFLQEPLGDMSYDFTGESN